MTRPAQVCPRRQRDYHTSRERLAKERPRRELARVEAGRSPQREGRCWKRGRKTPLVPAAPSRLECGLPATPPRRTRQAARNWLDDENSGAAALCNEKRRTERLTSFWWELVHRVCGQDAGATARGRQRPVDGRTFKPDQVRTYGVSFELKLAVDPVCFLDRPRVNVETTDGSRSSVATTPW